MPGLGSKVWAAGADEAFAVGPDGGLFHYLAGTWTAQSSPTNVLLRNVWGRSNTEVYAVGDASTVLRFDGVQWQPMVTPAVFATEYHFIAGDGSDVYVSSNFDRYIYHLVDGQTWNRVLTPVQPLVMRALSAGPGGLLIGGGGSDGMAYLRRNAPW
jgi:hypothetical protein